MEFGSGSDEGPLLGFAKSSEVHFCEIKVFESFLPRANTCVNVLNLPYAEIRFGLYNHAFAIAYFGGGQNHAVPIHRQ